MDTKLFKKLETCNAEQSWENVRDIVAVQLMGENVFPVPFLRDATSFDIGHVILKGRRSKFEKLTGVMTSSLPVGQLSNFVMTGHDLMQRLGNVRKDKELKLNQAYEFHESDMKHGVKKTLTVQLWGCEKWAMDFAPKPGELVVDLLKKGYINIDKIYLITEVFYVTDVKVHVSIGDRDDDFLIKGQIPVGFSMVRYKLQNDGTLGACKKVKTSSWGARWTRNLKRDENDPLPFDPFQAAGSSRSRHGKDHEGVAV